MKPKLISGFILSIISQVISLTILVGLVITLIQAFVLNKSEMTSWLFLGRTNTIVPSIVAIFCSFMAIYLSNETYATNKEKGFKYTTRITAITSFGNFGISLIVLFIMVFYSLALFLFN